MGAVALAPRLAVGPVPEPLSPRRRGRLLGALLLCGGLGVLLAAQAVAFRDPFEPFAPQIAGLLLRTDWGWAWLGQAAVAIGVLLAALRSGRAGPTWAGLALLAAAGPAFQGHSWAAQPRLAGVAAEIAHGWAATLWLGGLVALVAAARRGLAPRALAGAVTRFSPLAMAAVATLMASGTWAVWTHAGGIGELPGSPWGRVLFAKLALFTAMAALGAWNWRVTLPRLAAGGDGAEDGGAGPAAFTRGAAVLEATLGLAILLTTGFLVGLSPPGG